MRINRLRANHFNNPIGFDLTDLSLSWVAESEGVKQKESRVEIALDTAFSDIVFDSGWKVLNNLDFNPLSGKRTEGEELILEAHTRYYWRVSVKAVNEDEGVSDIAFFETGKRQRAWEADWITAPFEEHPIFVHTFSAKKGQKARIYLTAVGLYEVYCNGMKVGGEELLPGYHSYDLRLMYQTFELDELLVDGDNEIKVMIGLGWYMGRFGFGGGAADIYGDKMTLIGEVFVDGKLVLKSDESWKCTKSPVLESNIYDGEIWDARLEEASVWECAVLLDQELADDMKSRLVERTNPPIQEVKELRPLEIITTAKGDTVLDFGQNLAGWFTFICDEAKGTEVTVDCAELMQDGEFYRENLRTAQARLVYISKGEKAVVRPHFTFYGFRYLRVKGIVDVRRADFRVQVLSSVTERTGYWETSNEKVNRLIENSRWGQLANFIDIPTDCPQRDERMGWTGDTQIFSPTACFQYDSAAFYAKFMEDVLLEQKFIDGSVPFVIPAPKINLMPGAKQSSGSCAWSDVATILPWTVYQFYGDCSLLRREYESMKLWIEFIRTKETEEHLWMSGFHFADWLALDNPNPGPMGKTDPFYCASGYYYYSTLLTAKAAGVLGLVAEAEEYFQLAEEIKTSIQCKYFDKDGLCKIDTQTGYVLAFMFDLCKEEDREINAKKLHEKLECNNMHLDTGFVGTGYLCKALSKAGLQKDAVTLLLQEEMPGWLYQVIMGATTIWERWNSILPDGHINEEGMNSLNHYANGAVCQWIYEDLAGITPIEAGFKKIAFSPKVDTRFNYVKGSYNSAMGTYQCAWEKTENGHKYALTVPFDCSAIVEIEGMARTEVGAGSYHFETYF